MVKFASAVLVIGYGNTLRGDDGVGVVAAGQVRAAFPDVDVMTCHQLTPELAEPISRAQLVLFLDASAETPPGTLTTQRLTPDRAETGGLTHHVSPSTLLALARELFAATPEAHLLTVGAASFVFGAALTDPVQHALPALLRQVEEIIGRNPARG